MCIITIINKINFMKLKKQFKTIIILAICFLIIIGGYFSFRKIFKPDPKQIYEVAVMVRDQYNSNPEEDKKTSLKIGDVLVIQKAGHRWSNTEKVSYLILKMNLTEKQKTKLTQAKEKEIKFKNLTEEEQTRIKEEKKRTKDSGEEYYEEQRMETLIAREYYVDLSREEFEGFSANNLLSGQPYIDDIFDWDVVERKK